MNKKYDWKRIADRMSFLFIATAEEDDEEINLESLGLFYRFFIMNDVMKNLSAITITPDGDMWAQWINGDDKVSVSFGLKQHIVIWKVGGKHNSKGSIESFAIEKVRSLIND